MEPEHITHLYEELGNDLVEIGNELLGNIKNFKAAGVEVPLVTLQGTLAVLCHSHVLTMQQCSRSSKEVFSAGLQLMKPTKLEDAAALGASLEGCSAMTMQLLSNLESALAHAMDHAQEKEKLKLAGIILSHPNIN